MIDGKEYLNIGFLEQVKAEVGSNALRIKDRSAETLRENFERAMTGIGNFYFGQRARDRRFPLLPLSKQRTDKELSAKAKTFRQYFEGTAFSEIIHATDKEIVPGEDGVVILKSLKELSGDIKEGEIDKHQGGLDELIGSDEYVFANSSYLQSKNCRGKYVYKIEEKEGYVVPLDIDEVPMPGKLDQAKYYDAVRLFFVSRNIFRMEDFKQFFSAYCAAVFNNPEEALDFLRRNHFSVMFAAVYDSEERFSNAYRRKEDLPMATKIRNLYTTKGIVPPFSPEWQFKKQVVAKQIDKRNFY